MLFPESALDRLDREDQRSQHRRLTNYIEVPLDSLLRGSRLLQPSISCRRYGYEACVPRPALSQQRIHERRTLDLMAQRNRPTVPPSNCRHSVLPSVIRQTTGFEDRVRQAPDCLGRTVHESAPLSSVCASPDAGRCCAFSNSMVLSTTGLPELILISSGSSKSNLTLHGAVPDSPNSTPTDLPVFALVSSAGASCLSPKRTFFKITNVSRGESSQLASRPAV